MTKRRLLVADLQTQAWVNTLDGLVFFQNTLRTSPLSVTVRFKNQEALLCQVTGMACL